MKKSGKKDDIVNIDHVIRAFDELKQSKIVHALLGLRKFEIIVLLALYQIKLEKKVDKVLIDALQEKSETILNSMKQHKSILDLPEDVDIQKVKRY